jgi:hypothetical protein
MSKKVKKFTDDYHNCFKNYNEAIQESSFINGYEAQQRLIVWLIDDIDSCTLLREESFSDRQKRETVRIKVFFDKLKLKALKKLRELKLKLNETDEIINSLEKKKKKEKKINDYFQNIADKTKFLKELKEVFSTEKGQKIRALIENLKKEEMLLIGEREFKNFICELRTYFNRDIGEYQGIQNKTVNWEIETEYTIEKLNPLISKYKKPI